MIRSRYICQYAIAPIYAKIVAYKVLGWPVAREWVDWAVEMLEAGHDTKELRMLAGEYEPFDSDWVVITGTEILDDLQIDTEIDRVITRYIYYLISATYDNAQSRRRTMDKLYQLALRCNDREPVQEFFALDCELDVLQVAQPGDTYAGKTEDEVIQAYFAEWVRRYKNG